MADSRGDYIWICDDDDIAEPDAAEILSGFLDAAPEVGLAGGGYTRFRDTPGGPVAQGPGYWPDLSRGTPLRHILEDIFLFQNATLARREVYDRVGPFREDLARSIDYEMLVRLALATPAVLTERSLFRQRKHDGDRGPAAARHAAARSEDVWKAADRSIFADFRDRIPMSVYEAMFDAGDPAVARRAGLLQRGCVYARRTDWDAALEDFAAAVRAAPATGLSDAETAILRRAMAGKHGIDEALSRRIASRMVALARIGPAGAEVAATLARGGRWRLREAASNRRWGTGARVGGLLGALTLAGARRSAADPAEVAERDRLPAEAHVTLRPA